MLEIGREYIGIPVGEVCHIYDKQGIYQGVNVIKLDRQFNTAGSVSIDYTLHPDSIQKVRSWLDPMFSFGDSKVTGVDISQSGLSFVVTEGDKVASLNSGDVVDAFLQNNLNRLVWQFLKDNGMLAPDVLKM